MIASNQCYDEVGAQTLTETEKRFVTALIESDSSLSWLDITNPEHMAEIRDSMSRIAYHEAGHFAARCFTRLELSHVVKISIIPKEYSSGRMTIEGNFTRLSLLERSMPVSVVFERDVCRWKGWERAHGIMLLLEDFAGYGADVLSDQDGEWASIWDYWAENCFDDDDDEGDMSRASEVAEVMSDCMPASRILRLADTWTLEMLRIPAIWNIVEITHKRLLEHGELTFEQLEDLAWNIQDTVYSNPKWRRRVLKELAKKRTGRVV